MAMVRKITAKVVCGMPDKRAIINSDGEPMWQMAVYGSAHRSIAGETDYGPYIKFRGRFEAINLDSGETFQSSNLILPPIAEELLEDALTADNVKSVEFGLRVGVRKDESSVSGYVWVAESIRDTEETDPLERLRAELTDAKVIPMLESPEKEAEKPATRSRAKK